MFYTIYAESTPNPTTMKFVANKKLVDHSVEAKSPEEAKKINIAQKLFMFPFTPPLLQNERVLYAAGTNSEGGCVLSTP